MPTMRRPVGAEGGIHWTWIGRGGRFSSLAKRSSAARISVLSNSIWAFSLSISFPRLGLSRVGPLAASASRRPAYWLLSSISRTNLSARSFCRSAITLAALSSFARFAFRYCKNDHRAPDPKTTPTRAPRNVANHGLVARNAVTAGGSLADLNYWRCAPGNSQPPNLSFFRGVCTPTLSLLLSHSGASLGYSGDRRVAHTLPEFDRLTGPAHTQPLDSDRFPECGRASRLGT